MVVKTIRGKALGNFSKYSHHSILGLTYRNFSTGWADEARMWCRASMFALSPVPVDFSCSAALQARRLLLLLFVDFTNKILDT